MKTSDLEANEDEEEAVIKQPNDWPQSTSETIVMSTITMILDRSQVQTAGHVQRQRNTEYQQLQTTTTTCNNLMTTAAATTNNKYIKFLSNWQFFPHLKQITMVDW